MLIKIQSILLLFFALQVIACTQIQNREPIPPPEVAAALTATAMAKSNLPVSAALAESFRLIPGQQAELESAGLTLQFQTVLNDWRCPSKVECAEAGNATVVLDVWLADQEPTRFEVHVNPPPFKRDVLYDTYQIQLLALNPYPEVIDQVIPLEDYRATLVVHDTTATQAATATPTGPIMTIVERGDGPSLEAETFYQKGLTYVAAGLPEEAIASLTEAITLYPAYAEAYQYRGDAYSQLRRYDLARTDYQQVLALNPAPEIQATITAALQEIAQLKSVQPTATVTPTPAPATPLPSAPVSITLGEPFSLKLNQQGILEADGLTLEFSEILEDTRCPRQVLCEVAGQARLVIHIWLNDQLITTVELNTDLSLIFSYDAYQIRMVSLDPYPETLEHQITPEDYRATFVVSKKFCNRNEIPANDGSIRIYLFKSRNPAIASIPIQIDNTSGWKPLLAVDVSQSDLVINENNLICYDWQDQTFTLPADFRKDFSDEKNPFFPNYNYFVFVLGQTPVVGGIILPSISAVGSRIPVLQESFATVHSENNEMEMVLRANNLSGVLPIFPGDDTALIEKVRQRLQEIGKLVESGEFQSSSPELVVVGRLVRIDNTPECGIDHVGAVAEYAHLTVLHGTYSHKIIFVIHACPELSRHEYAQGSGDLESFQVGDYHELHLTRQDIYGIGTGPGGSDHSDGRLYFCREVNLYRVG